MEQWRWWVIIWEAWFTQPSAIKEGKGKKEIRGFGRKETWGRESRREEKEKLKKRRNGKDWGKTKGNDENKICIWSDKELILYKNQIR